MGGAFTTWNSTTANRIVRLNSNGRIDSTFATNSGGDVSSTVFSIAIQPDGKILLGGGFSSFNGTYANRIIRLNTNGTIDSSFISSGGGSVRSIALQSDGKILIGGAFTSFSGASVNRIVRLNSSGTRDATFTNNVGTAANSDIYSIAVDANGKILVGGGFSNWNGTQRGSLVCLNSD